MTSFVAAAALLPDGWARDVRIDVGADGVIAAVGRDVPAAQSSDAERLAGPVVPAMPNLHSHAFQRALAGRTGRAAGAGGDSFWTWRQAMYGMLERLDADGFAAVTAQAYVEMVKVGLRRGRRVPLRPPRPRRAALRGSRRARAAPSSAPRATRDSR